MAVDLKLSEVTELERHGLTQVIQYADDILEAWSNDGARFLVSGCGTAFAHWRRVRNSWEQSHQYTHFCLSAYKDQMAALIRLRNLYSDRPFLCSSLINPTCSTCSPDCKYVFWPQSVSEASPFITANGLSLELRSREGTALVAMHQHAQSFTVSYVAPLCEGKGPLHCTSKGANIYSCWVTQRHSILFIPDCWRHPVSLLLEYKQQLLHIDQTGDNCGEHTSHTLPVSTPVPTAHSSPLPTALPHSCTNTHLHQLHITAQGRNHRVKVMYTEGIIYRLFADCQTPCVEATPCESALLRSYDPEGRFFQSWSCLPSGQVCSQLYCNDHLPPPTAHLSYSVARVLGLGRRLLATSSVASVQPCWQLSSLVLQTPTLVLESTEVPGVGSFTAFKSGWIRVCFTDRTLLDFHCPDLAVDKQSSLKVDQFTELGPNMCRLMLPNGRYETFSVTAPLQFAWYAHVTLRWTAWVGTPRGERGDFIMEEGQEEDMKRKVITEISNIERALELSPCHAAEWTAGDKSVVQDVLARTRSALDKTDKLLQQQNM